MFYNETVESDWNDLVNKPEPYRNHNIVDPTNFLSALLWLFLEPIQFYITVTHQNKIDSCRMNHDICSYVKMSLEFNSPKKNAGYTRRWNRDTSDSSTGISGTNPNAIMYGIVNIIIKVDATGQTTTQRKFFNWKFLAPFSSFDNMYFVHANHPRNLVIIQTFLIINIFKGIS